MQLLVIQARGEGSGLCDCQLPLEGIHVSALPTRPATPPRVQPSSEVLQVLSEVPLGFTMLAC